MVAYALGRKFCDISNMSAFWTLRRATENVPMWFYKRSVKEVEDNFTKPLCKRDEKIVYF